MRTAAPSGEQHTIEHGSYRATVTEVGASLRALSHDGRPLVRGFAADEVMPLYSGAVLAPWPNRLADGRYEYDGKVHQLPLNEPERHNAVHGLVAWQPWDLRDRTASSVRLGTWVWPSPGYPFALDLEIGYALGPGGLDIELTAVNAGQDPAPYACSIHPYFIAGEGEVDDWSLELPAGAYLDVDDERLLPTELLTVEGRPFDFRRAAPLRGLSIDHAFTALDFDGDGCTEAVVRDTNGSGVRIRWAQGCPWVQVHTADRPEAVYDRKALAVEPMTCPPNAFVSGADLITLQPAESRTVTWQIGIPRVGA